MRCIMPNVYYVMLIVIQNLIQNWWQTEQNRVKCGRFSKPAVNAAHS